MPKRDELEDVFEWANIVYIPGGDTLQMMETWKEYGIDRLLARRAFEDMVISGISAGAVAPFVWGHSDSSSYRISNPDEPWDYIPVAGLGIINAAITPHYNTKPKQ